LLDVYIDADACPVKEDTFRVSKRYGLKVYVVSNSSIVLPKADWILPVVVGGHFDAVDDWIEANVKPNDIVITNDLLLAARCLKKESRVIDPRGNIRTEDNIGEALATRELLSELRQMGAMNTGPKKMGKNHRSNFLSELDRLINQIKKSTS
jgi:uncharacterized protein